MPFSFFLLKTHLEEANLPHPFSFFCFFHNQLEELISVSIVLNEPEVMVIREALSFFKNKFTGKLVFRK